MGRDRRNTKVVIPKRFIGSKRMLLISPSFLRWVEKSHVKFYDGNKTFAQHMFPHAVFAAHDRWGDARAGYVELLANSKGAWMAGWRDGAAAILFTDVPDAVRFRLYYEGELSERAFLEKCWHVVIDAEESA